MKDALPKFPYHPDPLATGAVVTSDHACASCGKTRGYIYSCAPYAEDDDLAEAICPWCIADGSAAQKFSATFVQDIEDGAPEAVVSEIMERTPGYECWQGETWLCHCDDACEFHGEPSRADLQHLSGSDEQRLLDDNGWLEDDWPALKAHYQKGGDVALYKFVCRHCGIVRFAADQA